MTRRDTGNMSSTAAILAALIIILPPITLAGDLHGFRATLARIHQLSIGKHTEAVRRDSHRIAFLSAGSTAVGKATTNSSVTFQALLESRVGGYNMNLFIGSPPLTFPVLADTGSDLLWTQCAPCTKCFQQPAPPFQPGSSSTFSKLPCTSSFCQFLPNSSRTCNATGCVYDYTYGSGYTAGYLATETLKVGESSFSNVAFGCSTENRMDNSSSGIAGLGRGALSLVSQLGVGRFSYCLRSDVDAGGGSPILFGSLAKLTDGNVQSTPFVKNPASRPTFYYVNLTGITVGATDLPVTGSTFGFTQGGAGGGTVMDSGSTYTYLAKDGYTMVKQAFLSQMANLTAVNGTRFNLDLCFNTGAGGDVPAVPRLVLRFAGGAEYDVPLQGYFHPVEADSQGRVTVACLMVLPTTHDLPVSIIGNLMQTDLHVLYDLDGGMFYFAPVDCSKV